MSWTYHRGHWIEHKEYPVSPRGAQAQDRVRKWGLQARWRHFPELGPVPEKWMDVGPSPTGVALFSECMTAFYLDPIAGMLNEPSTLLSHFL